MRQVTQFYRAHGTIVAYRVHPSNEYVIVLSHTGYYYIFNIADGDMRGKVTVERECLNLQVDNSGLYLAIHTPRQTLQVYEVGTGKKVYEFKPDFD